MKYLYCRVHRALARLALHREEGLCLLEHDEIDLAPVRVADRPQLHPVPLGVFEEMAVLQKLRSDEVFESPPASGTWDQSHMCSFCSFLTALMR